MRFSIDSVPSLLITAGTLLASSSAFAVRYDLPSGGYHQLQSRTTWQTVCATGGESCDVPPGDYVHVDFRTSPASRENVNVSAPTGAGAGAGTGARAGSAFTRVDGDCTFPDPAASDTGRADLFGEVATCAVDCPSTAPRLYGVLACGASFVSEVYTIEEFGTSFEAADSVAGRADAVSCGTPEGARFHEGSLAPYERYRMSVAAMCGPR